MKIKKQIPFQFFLDELDDLAPRTRAMFGCYGVYVGDKIVAILREKDDKTRADNGIWIATTSEHHASLKKDFRSMRSIYLFSDGGPTGWQNLPEDSGDFEESAMKLIKLIRMGDPRIGKVPAKKRKAKDGLARRKK